MQEDWLMLLEGQVWDAHTGYPLAGARVACAGPEGVFQAYSDEDGYFRFSVAKSGPWQVTVEKAPYTGASRGSLLARTDVFLNFGLTLVGLEDEPITA
jgi:hypothetical protein